MHNTITTISHYISIVFSILFIFSLAILALMNRKMVLKPIHNFAPRRFDVYVYKLDLLILKRVDDFYCKAFAQCSTRRLHGGRNRISGTRWTRAGNLWM